MGSRGPQDAEVVFVAEAPGTEEIRHGIPLYGPSGKLFWDTFPHQLKDWGVDPDSFLILNSMQCVPPRHQNQTINEANKSRGAEACHDRLMSEILSFPRKLIVAMGNHALRSITGNAGYKITQTRGALIASPYASIGILPVVHPAALLRGTGNYRQFKNDLQYAIDLLLGAEPKAPTPTAWIEHDDPRDILQITKELCTAEYLAADIETTGVQPLRHSIVSIGIASDPALVHIFPEHRIPLLRRLFMEASGRWIWHNGKFDIGFLRHEGIPEARVDEDTMLLSYALDENRGIHDLEQVSADLLGAPDYKGVMRPWMKSVKGTDTNRMRECPKEEHYNYLALDVSNTLQDFDILRRDVAEDPHLEKLYTKVLIPASETLHWVERRGITVCRNRLEMNRVRLDGLVKNAYDRLQAVSAQFSNEEINPNSPQQVAHLLFDQVRLRPPRANSRSTAKDVLDKLPKHPVVKALKEYRKASKALSTYVDGFDRHILEDGRVHATYLIHGTRTGRLSSRNPNMQNIPRDKKLRGMFHAGEGRRFVKVDLNQAELRSLAHFSQDPFLVTLYNDPKGLSLHDEIATEFFGKDFTPEDKMIAKNVNFGIVYGITPPGLAEQIKRPVGEAVALLDRWFKRCAGAKQFIDYCREAPKKGLTLITPFGRKKRHWIVTLENLHTLQNEASNYPHQSSASDITLTAAGIAGPILRERDVWIENLIHDEILTSAPNDPEVIAWAAAVIINVMQQVPLDWGLTRVPFVAEADTGRRWGLYVKKPKAKKQAQLNQPDQPDQPQAA